MQVLSLRVELPAKKSSSFKPGARVFGESPMDDATDKKFHANWLCYQCLVSGLVSTTQEANLKAAIKTAHAAKSPDCENPQIATLPHAYPH